MFFLGGRHTAPYVPGPKYILYELRNAVWEGEENKNDMCDAELCSKNAKMQV